MVATAFDALGATELALEGLQVMAGEAGNARVRAGTLRAISLRLTQDAAPARAAAREVRADRPGDRPGPRAWSPTTSAISNAIYEQLNRLIDGIDAAADSMAKVMDLRMNETIYWLTVVATIFLPLTFLSGFFGMNFAWMIGEIDTEAAFLLLGVGGLIVATAPDLVRRQAAGDADPARPGRLRTTRHQPPPPTRLSPAAGTGRDQMGQGRAGQRCTAVQRHRRRAAY